MDFHNSAASGTMRQLMNVKYNLFTPFKLFKSAEVAIRDTLLYTVASDYSVTGLVVLSHEYM